MLAAFWRSGIEPFRATDEGVATLKKTKQLIGGAGDADAHTFADEAGGMVDFAEPEFFVCAEINAIVAAIDLQRLREASRTAREIQKLGGFTMALHDFDSFKRLERANQNGRGGFGRLANDIEHKVRAVVEENVNVAGSKIHGFDARGGPAEMMPGGIARRIRFGLNDAAADAAGGKFVHHDFADEEAREFDGVLGKFGAVNPANGSLSSFLVRRRLGGHFQADSIGRIF